MTLYIIIITCIVSLIAFAQPAIMDRLIFSPYMVKSAKQWYRFFTCGLLHGDLFHLGVNMYVLYSFGNAVEYYYRNAFGHNSWIFYLLLYVTSIFAANASTYSKQQNNPDYRSLGASGAVSAIVFAAILFNPFSKITLYFAIELPGIVLGVIYLGYSYYMSKKGSGADNINHDAHLYGAIYGIAFTLVLKPALFSAFIHKLL